ncbi:hypothetical protein BG015_006193 [Linnemannia schmuckeri]|uniref:Serine/threonine-protein phosphatase 4 regulatory subunit 3-like central domain-containing protein n=1 Tax=Linnemannia schmuckeri TaxID=64567 RepID=A0A9P5S2C2_9FUNG|nr:hypothetical protein BG015_006193 [Linnemannia schmuckeri]
MVFLTQQHLSRLKTLPIFSGLAEKIAILMTHIIIGLLQNTKGNRNAMNSACLEFFEHIRKNNVDLMVFQCGAINRETMEGLSYTPLFKQLLTMHTSKDNSEPHCHFLGPRGSGPSAGSVKSLLMELFGDDDKDDLDAARIDRSQSNQLCRKLQETDFDEAGGRDGTTASDCSSGKRIMLEDISST